MGAYCVEYDLKTKYFVLLKHEIEKQLLTLFLQQDFIRSTIKDIAEGDDLQ